MKYILELKDDVQVVQKVGVTENGNAFVMNFYKDQLEELNSDYINEHFSGLQDDAYNKGYAQCQDDYSDALKHAKDTAYKKGLHDGESKCGYCNEYQRGLDDAWEAARKIIHMPEGDLLNIFTECYSAVCTALQVLLKYDAAEAIEKLKAYEEKQKADDEIKVGDEVDWSGDKFIVTRIFQPYDKAEECDGVDMDGCTYHDVLISGLTKTGRHVDITDMLKGTLE